MTIPTWITLPGSIGSVVEGNTFTYSLQYDNSPTSVSLIAGNLPAGLVIDSAANITGTAAYIVGTTSLEENTTVSNFTVRLQNASGIADRTFSIEVDNITPIWSSPANLGTFQNYSQYSFSLSVFDPGGSTQTFELLGVLPNGLNFNSFGRVYGVFDQESTITSQTYSFPVICYLDGTSLQQTFNITVLNSGNPAAEVTPVWLTPAGLLGGISAGKPFSVQVIAEASNTTSPVSYTALNLPPGFSINAATGVISGTLANAISNIYSFTVTASVGVATSTQIFSLNANEAIIFPITVNSPTNLGTLQVGQVSNLQIQATSSSPWLRFTITSGSLPAGLTLDLVTGEIEGIVQVQNLVSPNFPFTVQIYNDNTIITQSFVLDVVEGVQTGATTAYCTVYGMNKFLWLDLLDEPRTFIVNVYREGDPNYGYQYYPQLLLAQNLNNPTQDQVFAVLNQERRTYINVGQVEVAQYIQNGTAIYDVLYRRIFDDDQGANMSVTDPVDTSVTVDPGSLANLRTQLLTLGLSGTSGEFLPEWMTTPQSNGTTLGWIPALVFIYLQPGLGAEIASEINEQEIPLQKLYMTRLRIDRLICSPMADTSFQPYTILYDSNY